MTKTYLDQCIRRAEKASHGPWHIGHINEGNDFVDIDSPEGSVAEEVSPYDGTFIVHARRDVPTLALRLGMAINKLRELGASEIFIKELEANPNGR